MPKRVIGPLEGLRVSSVSCVPWHTALVTFSGELFTFGDGTFGVLGHGDRISSSIPREIESLKGLRTVRVACGVWHTAAVVEVMVVSASASVSSCGKLFTWGDGDKGRLGHGDKEQKLVPTCVAALVKHNFRQVACGHSLIVALTTLGQVFTMGSSVYGQLGNPHADGKIPQRVEGRLSEAFIERISCGAFHVAVLTSKNEFYTWGKGANGRLGHGDCEDKKTPTLVEILKDKQVKTVACGASFTAAICLHKSVSGANHSICSGCHQPFGFTRKRHNCYHCGLVFCHACSSKKALRASMACSSNKPCRACDLCFNKLKKAAETGATFGRVPNKQVDISRKTPDSIIDKQDSTKLQLASPKLTAVEQFKLNEYKSYSKNNRRSETLSSRVSPVRSNTFAQHLASGPPKRLVSASVPQSRIVSRATSPVPSRRSSPPRSITPTPTLISHISPKIPEEDTRIMNENLAQEVLKLQSQVENLTRRCQLQESELKHSASQLQEAIKIAGEETAKCKAAKDVIKSLTVQLKRMTEQLSGDFHPYDNSETTPLSQMRMPNVPLPVLASCGLSSSTNINGFSRNVPGGSANGGAAASSEDGAVSHLHGGRLALNQVSSCDRPSHFRSTMNYTSTENGHALGVEWIEHDEQGVYITLMSLPGGGRDLKRVRFSRKRFSEKQAELWWQENKARVHEQYNIRVIGKSVMGASVSPRLGEEEGNSSSSNSLWDV